MIITGQYVMATEWAILFSNIFNHSDFRFVSITSADRFLMEMGGNKVSVTVSDSLSLDYAYASMKEGAERIRQCFVL